MDALSSEQQAVKSKITTGAIIWGVIVGLLVALVAFLVLGNAPDWLRWLLTVVLGGVAGGLVFRFRYNAAVAKAVCRKCGTAFGIREVERHERFLSSEPKQKSEAGKPATKLDRGTNKLTTWTEEKYEVTAVDECFRCHDRTERKWQVTRETDKKETEVPA